MAAHGLTRERKEDFRTRETPADHLAERSVHFDARAAPSFSAKTFLHVLNGWNSGCDST
jgi:hypothetical protein